MTATLEHEAEVIDMTTRARSRSKVQWDGSVNLNTIIAILTAIGAVIGGIYALGREGEKIDGIYGAVGALQASVTGQVDRLTARVDRLYDAGAFK